MTEHLRLIARQLYHLERMADYLRFSYERVQPIVAALDWPLLSPEQHESLAAFRVRFSEFQEHLGKTMRAVAIEEEIETERFGAVLAFMEKMGILDSTEHWKLLRELRNAVNHEYEEEAEKLEDFFVALVDETPNLFDYFQRLLVYCRDAYGILPEGLGVRG